jgi:hypothetical protein
MKRIYERAIGWILWLVIYLYARAFGKRHDICDGEGDLYLRRWYLNSAGTIMLHRFTKSDRGRGHHNHPWVYMRSRILRGSYVEHRPEREPRRFEPGMINTLFANTFHRVTLDNGKPVWTLFGVGPKHGNSWGFISPSGRYKRRPEGMGACPGSGALDVQRTSTTHDDLEFEGEDP